MSRMPVSESAPSYTDTDGVTLTITPVDASEYYGTTPVVALATVHPDGDDDPVLYIAADDIEDVIATIRKAAADARALHAAADGSAA